MSHIFEVLHKIAGKLQEVKVEAEAEELAPSTDVAPAPAEAPVEEKDRETLLQEHVKNNVEKYTKAFEELFPATQMAVKNIEYRGMLQKDKIRVMVDFETTLLNYDALQVLSDKEIGLEASGEKMFRVYNIYLPRVKDPNIKLEK